MTVGLVTATAAGHAAAADLAGRWGDTRTYRVGERDPYSFDRVGP